MEVRLQKFIADAGICSRRAAEKLILRGQVKVNGQVVTEMGIKIDPIMDEVEYKGDILHKVSEFEYYLLHKPRRVVSTASDEKNRTNVVEMVKSNHRLYPVGRLDYMSSGLIILTNDGDMTFNLTHPSHEVDKQYLAKVSPKITEDDLEKLREGVLLDGDKEKTLPCKIKMTNEDATSQTYSIILREGKNRQIRRMVEIVGSKVESLERISIGEIKIQGLKYGMYRHLDEDEITYLKNL